VFSFDVVECKHPFQYSIPISVTHFNMQSRSVESAHVIVLALIVIRIQHNFGGCAMPKKDRLYSKRNMMQSMMMLRNYSSCEISRNCCCSYNLQSTIISDITVSLVIISCVYTICSVLGLSFYKLLFNSNLK
jgi:hypothetical protein